MTTKVSTQAPTLGLVGATGGTGSAILRLAIERGVAVKALVRSPDKLAAMFPSGLPANVVAIKGDATHEGDMRKLLEAGIDVAVLAVGTSSLEKNSVCLDTAVALVRAAARWHFTTSPTPAPLRVVTVSGGGLGAKPGFIMEKILVPAFLKEPLFDALQMEAALRTAPPEALQSTIVRPYRLTDGPASGHVHVVAEDFHAPIVLRYTTRADVAQAVLDEAASGAHLGSVINVYTGGA
jgi:uncharacterized protein YbjT (DUF2867 family)